MSASKHLIGGQEEFLKLVAQVREEAVLEFLKKGIPIDELRWHKYDLLVHEPSMTGFRFEMLAERTDDGGVWLKYVAEPVKLTQQDISYPPED